MQGARSPAPPRCLRPERGAPEPRARGRLPHRASLPRGTHVPRCAGAESAAGDARTPPVPGRRPASPRPSLDRDGSCFRGHLGPFLRRLREAHTAGVARFSESASQPRRLRGLRGPDLRPDLRGGRCPRLD